MNLYRNIIYYLQVFSNHIFGILHNGPVVIDGFFGLGGLILSYFFLKYLNDTKKFNFFCMILKRLVRYFTFPLKPL